MDTYVLNQWTHGLSDTQQNNTSLFNVGYFSKSFIHMSIEISGHMDLWTHGLSDTQQKNISLFSTQRSTADKQAHIIKNKNLLVCE